MIQDSQEFGSDDEHMVSRVFFTLWLDDKSYPDLSANVKQTVGSSFEDAPLEVSKPTGYSGPFNYDAFRTAAEKYYRSCIGSSGIAMRVGEAKNIRMQNVRVNRPVMASFKVDPENKAW
jgi:hypothetical protein